MYLPNHLLAESQTELLNRKERLIKAQMIYNILDFTLSLDLRFLQACCSYCQR